MLVSVQSTANASAAVSFSSGCSGSASKGAKVSQEGAGNTHARSATGRQEVSQQCGLALSLWPADTLN